MTLADFADVNPFTVVWIEYGPGYREHEMLAPDTPADWFSFDGKIIGGEWRWDQSKYSYWNGHMINIIQARPDWLRWNEICDEST